MCDLLFEIGTEELPAGFLDPASAQLAGLFAEKAKVQRIGHGAIKVMATPRRLAILVSDVAKRQEDIRQELLGPAKAVAFDINGTMTKAAEGFAKSKGVTPDELEVVLTSKGEYLMVVRNLQGRKTSHLLPELLHSLILDLSFPKSMKWGKTKHSFARPIQWIVAVFAEEIVRFSHEGIESSNFSSGHRFLAKERFAIQNTATYEQQLLDRHVLVDPAKRRTQLLVEVERAIAQSTELRGGHVAIDESLIDTVTNLVEMPFAVCGVFDDKFLQLPPEVLITSMREHQKCFSVINDSGDLLPGFVAINNTKVNNVDITRRGHQRVLRARLEDALFFYDNDKETRLETLIPRLEGIIFQAKLGTMLEKNARLIKLVRVLADKIDPSLAEDCCRAAFLCKADLLSDMVGEFPSLQGIMGSAYAVHDGEKHGVATAIKEHYMPKRAGTEIPQTDIGAILGLADRLDTLVGYFAIDKIPSGTADPFGLRRISLAIIHIITGKKYIISLREILYKALSLYGDKAINGDKTVEATLDFIKRRFINDCGSRGLTPEGVDAVVPVDFDDINSCIERIEAVLQVSADPEFEGLVASYKRIKNITKDNRQISIKPGLFEHGAEGNLYALLLDVQKKTDRLIAARQYTKSLVLILKMKEPIDTFFDEVMVMTEDAAIRQNRLNLLTGLGRLVLRIGDISRM